MEVVIDIASHHLPPMSNQDIIQYHSSTPLSVDGVELFGGIIKSVEERPRKLNQVWADPKTLLTLNTHDGILSVWSGPFVSTQRLDLFLEDGRYMWGEILQYTARFIALVQLQEVMES